MSIVDELAEARACAAAWEREHDAAVDQMGGILRDLRALTCSCQPQTHMEPSAWNPDCPQHGMDSEWFEAEEGRRQAHATISDLRHQLGEAHKRHKAMADALAVRADENQRLQYELRTANQRGDAWRDELRSDEARIAELEAERDNWQGVAELAQRERDEAITGRKTADAVTVAAKELLTRRTTRLRERAEQAEAEAAQTKAELRRMETRVSNYRAALERIGRCCGNSNFVANEALGYGRIAHSDEAAAAEREPDGYDPLGTERWVDGEPSNDISQWETNGTSID